MGADKNSIGGNPNNIWCNECGDPRHPQDICQNEIYVEDFSVKAIECRNVQVKANEMERILFKINGLPNQTFSVRIKALKTHDKIQVLEKRELVVQKNKIQVDFKFLEPMSLNTKDLNNLFVCEIFQKLNNYPVTEISSPPKIEESSNFRTYVAAVKEKKIPWDIFSSLVKDLSKTLQDTKTLNELLLQEWKNSRDHEAELEAELEESKKIIEKFHQATKKINQLAQPPVTRKRLQNDDNDIQKYQPEIKKQKNVYNIQSGSNNKNSYGKEFENDKSLESEEILPNILENDINMSGDSDNENDNEAEIDNNLEPLRKIPKNLENVINLSGHSDNEHENDDEEIFSNDLGNDIKLSGGYSDNENDDGEDNERENDNESIFSNDLGNDIKLSGHSVNDNDKNLELGEKFSNNLENDINLSGGHSNNENDNESGNDNKQDERETQTYNSSKVLQYHNRKTKFKKERHFESDNDSQNNSKGFKCHVCGLSFSYAGNLKAHNHAVHEGHKDYKCKYCAKRFTQKGTMNRHLKVKHPNAVQLPIRRRKSYENHKCNNCTKTFRSSRDYNFHVDTGRCEIHIVKQTLRKKQRTLKSSKKLKKSKLM